MKNTGALCPDDILILDPGVETAQLYSADLAKPFPMSGRYTSAQRDVVEVVSAACRAGIAAVRPGAPFRAPHQAAMEVLLEGLRSLGVLPHPRMTHLDPLEAVRRWSLSLRQLEVTGQWTGVTGVRSVHAGCRRLSAE